MFLFCSTAAKWISHQFETEAYKCPDFLALCKPSLKETVVENKMYLKDMFVYIVQKLWLFTLIAFVFNLDFFGGIPVCHGCWRVKMQFCVFVDFCCH